MKHILIIDDDTSVRSLLVDYLSQHAFRVTGIGDSAHLARILATDTVDLVIVDLNLGHEDGLEIIRTLSRVSDAPAIIISGDRVEEADKVVGLELGAVDYITKPFGTREFLARVRASLRPRPTIQNRKERRVYAFDDWILNMKLRKLVRAGTTEVKLTAGEFNLLTAFLKSPQQVLSREQLLAASRVHNEEVFDRSIDVLILRLRRKLEADPSRPNLIKTERGVGYIFDSEVRLTDSPHGRA
ncbi:MULTISPECIES: winged helix-turn-helix domain-containing protein [Pseudorhizobium]|uniref:Regulatory protein VirG n=1 Tax=Pseudorhizobium pelagicum TaxID=1509405 RepID=A0A922P2R7_9HYPH|nr:MULTISPECIES: winged helix-turn-helix domain-containing protein [Pseudorhizobium]MBU1315860.1 winged helix-turn-helix domain-containing protein [Alphaproteobacteria bacterium]KEQ02572.1 regulatory protein VirG [Pseudorhizobium pelagicum]KEQ10707.1 regulatory protein VirG [Pseudorhizobium pelagicum]MBU1549499.1 winged helix-turn-helix domain-containing protein [Alphaproteobacteria bacterium]MBU2335422.1 winged helix-turn-helix domain-containing protein [Alphaproteobacteria bacterium]